MKYNIEPEENKLTIKVTDTEGNQEKVMEAFQQCQAGQCSCPTNEYEKLADLSIEKTDHEIRLTLKSKADTEFNIHEINRCLDHTKSRLQDDK